MGTKARITPAALLLLGMDSLVSEGGVVSRAKWVARALVEEMSAAMPPGEAASSVDRYRDPQRGVTDKAVARATNELLRTGFIEPRGVGSEAVWVIAPRKETDVRRLWAVLTAKERSAVHEAAHRTFALEVAWSKTPRAAAHSS
ncbi:hypothetical protein [Intrasporangium chromatireducens]|uniref:hypothetical protein n=1 Tax=Intrasporangium chromatireducens TaxID=1386088 RepID=UPI0012DCDFC5|nr:hypothetical protein [Intrasporangium chromatireducens]